MHKIQWKVISKDTNIPYTTLLDLVYGNITNPKLDTIISLSNYFKITIDDLINKDLGNY